MRSVAVLTGWPLLMSIDRRNVGRFVKVGQEPPVESVQLAYGRDHHARDRGKSNEDLISSRSILGGLHHQYGHRSTEPGDKLAAQQVIAATPESPDVGLGSE
jgi:hypothetical protein